jgi:hypothetical protein
MTSAALTAADRCDRCSAQAQVRAVLPSGSLLLFCVHHAREFEPGLRAAEADIITADDSIPAGPLEVS